MVAEYNRFLLTIATASVLLAESIATLNDKNYPTNLRSLIDMSFGVLQPKSLVGWIGFDVRSQ